MTDEERKRKTLEEARAHLDGSWSPERFRSEPVGGAPVRRTDSVEGVVYKVTENAPVAAAPGANDDAWNAWLTRELDARLDQERQLMIEVVGEVVAKLRAERDDSRSAEVSAEFARVWRAICETKKMMVDLQRERVERGFRDVSGDPAKKMN